jgi:hypothetical protein
MDSNSLYPKYKGGWPRTFTLPERREIKKIAKSRPAEHGLAFSTWSLAKLADSLVAEGVVDDISHEVLRVLLREEGIQIAAFLGLRRPGRPPGAAGPGVVSAREVLDRREGGVPAGRHPRRRALPYTPAAGAADGGAGA